MALLCASVCVIIDRQSGQQAGQCNGTLHDDRMTTITRHYNSQRSALLLLLLLLLLLAASDGAQMMVPMMSDVSLVMCLLFNVSRCHC